MPKSPKKRPEPKRFLLTEIKKLQTNQIENWGPAMSAPVVQEMLLRIANGSNITRETTPIIGDDGKKTQPYWELPDEDGVVRSFVVPPQAIWRRLFMSSKPLRELKDEADEMWLQTKEDELLDIPINMADCHPSMVREHGENIRFVLSKRMRHRYGHQQEVIHHNTSGPQQVNIVYHVVKDIDPRVHERKVQKEVDEGGLKLIEDGVEYTPVRANLEGLDNDEEAGD